jgi:Na+:H+ antiporter, NhaA family
MFRRTLARVARGLDHDYAAAVTISMGALVGLVWSGVAGSSYQRAFSAWPSAVSGLGIASWRDFIGSGLMTVFFFAVGLEVARERHHGSLRDLRHALAPMLAALAGMTGPAIILVAAGLVTHTHALVHGWGVPMATDIAFTLAALAVAGSSLPRSLRAFLLTLAITDDVVSIVILAATGATHVRVAGLAATGAVLVVVAGVSRFHRSTPWRLVALVALWWGLAYAGVEPPLAGVLAALAVPYDAHRSIHLESGVTRLSVGIVLPFFAAAYCGVTWSHLGGSTSLTIIAAVVIARLIGKTVGIALGVSAARRLGARVASDITSEMLTAAGLLCAIGLTVPLLFAGQLFHPGNGTYSAFDLGLLVASVLAAVAGVVLLRSAGRNTEGAA